jgi:1,6-anhydro-N-acetylmuramate kinase
MRQVIDAIMSLVTRGAVTHDAGGTFARSGRVIPQLLQRALRHPYFALPPPKSTGHEAFGARFASTFLARGRLRRSDFGRRGVLLIGRKGRLLLKALSERKMLLRQQLR